MQGPCRAGLPFFMVICWDSFISRLSLHLTQYAISAIFSPPLVAVFCILIFYSHSVNTCKSITHDINRMFCLCFPLTFANLSYTNPYISAPPRHCELEVKSKSQAI